MANEMQVERIFEPRLVINGDNRYIAMIGASNVNYRTIPVPTVSMRASMDDNCSAKWRKNFYWKKNL